MLLIRSLIFNAFLYTGIVSVFLIAVPALFLPSKLTLLFGKFLGHYVVFVVKFILNTKVEFRKTEIVRHLKCTHSSSIIDYEMQFEKSYLDPIKTALDVLGWNHERIGNLESFFS